MVDKEKIASELSYKAVRSSGAGGQHVNKTSSKVMVFWNVEESSALTDDQRHLLLKRLAHRLTKDGVLQLSSQESRSQHKNKAEVTQRLFKLLAENLQQRKKRKRTKPSIKSIKKRLNNKRIQSEKKANRKPPKM
ncbi:alternative ribosome rescue aminoacyl-tRNA hydrolase ArfB [Gangjinia marincola]|uniref:Alternative ribosome rescue aminoacyl-tRNA hydrolase ArfB n=1 Tax=Gangjinia marincola TaxID=578463 RepID=A0ABP3XWC3_9FLAO